MLKVRLMKGGQKHKPFYKIVIMQSKTKRNGFILKTIGFYNPKTKDFKFNILTLVKYLNCGVQPTKRVSLLLHRIHLLLRTL